MGVTVLPVRAEIRPEEVLTLNRSVAFTRSAWLATGGYPNGWITTKTLIFDLIKELGYSFAWQPTALALLRPPLA